MKSSIPLGRFAGIPVGAHWTVVFVLVLLTDLLATTTFPTVTPGHPTAVYWLAAAATAVAFMASLLVHEIAHAVVARRHGIKVKRITLWLLGGFTELDGEPATPRTDAMVALAGPMASFVVGALAIGLAETSRTTPLLTVALAWIGVTNGVLAVFNLLPATPLDGGHVLRAVVWKRTGDRSRGVAAAAQTGLVVGWLLVAAGITPVLYGQLGWLPLAVAGWFLTTSASVESAGSRLQGLRVGDVMTTDLTFAPGWYTVQAFLTQTASTSPHRTFPVVSFEGEPLGQICLADLTRLTPQARANTRVESIARSAPTARPKDALTKVALGARLRPGRDLVLVTENGHAVGVVTQHDITRAVELRALGQDGRPAHR
ncbi:site-2 protease family protein [Kibdelosporangium lantanae]